jgi:hypothetical protein
MQVYSQLPILSPQERLAYAWAVAQSDFFRSPLVSDRLLQRCREATTLLSNAEAYDLLADVPSLSVA